MARHSRFRDRARGDVHRPYGEEVAMLLALVVSALLALTLAALFLLEFLEMLPLGLAALVVVSLLAMFVVIGKAVLERALALPNTARSITPVIRHGGR